MAPRPTPPSCRSVPTTLPPRSFTAWASTWNKSCRTNKAGRCPCAPASRCWGCFDPSFIGRDWAMGWLSFFKWARSIDQGTDEAENLGPYQEPSKEDARDSKAWELNMLLKKAAALEQHGQWQGAMSCLEQVIAK